MIKFTRFEQKLLFALIAVAVMPMLGALFLGQRALREAYQVGVNEHVRGELERCLSLYRSHLSEKRAQAQSGVQALAHDYELRRALAAGDLASTAHLLNDFLHMHVEIAFLRLKEAGGTVLWQGQRPSSADRGQQPELRLSEDIAASTHHYRLEAVAHAPEEILVQYLQAGELVEVFTRLVRGRGTVSNYYLLVYMVFLMAVILVAVAVGVVLSRRVTRRVAVLANATARVGAGDLTVQVPTSDRDEIAELTRAFNTMVRDIQESRERIEYLQRLGAWQQFARRLAHEIKNPLTPIQLAVQELHRSYAGGDPVFQARLDDAAGIVAEEVATLRRLVTEFSNFARLPQADLAPADLKTFLQDVARSLTGLGAQYLLDNGRPAGQVVCDAGVAHLPVHLDKMMMQRCLDNLVRNALQALRDAGRSGTVRVTVRREQDAALLIVSDDGPGVPPEQRERIFDPYMTTKSDGTGLGLAIVKKVVFEHAGEIRCDPNVPSGASFVIRIPIEV